MKEAWSVVEVMTEMVKRFDEMFDEKELTIETVLGALTCTYELEKARYVAYTLRAAQEVSQLDYGMDALEKMMLKGKHDNA